MRPNNFSTKTPIYASGRVVGFVIEDIFQKKIIGSKHFLRRPPAIAIDIESLNQAENTGATCVEIIDRESKTRYRTTIKHLREKGKEFDRGFGRQIFLPLDRWVVTLHDGGQQLRLWK